MPLIRSLLAWFRSLRGKLTLTYMFVTVAALLALELIGMVGLTVLLQWTTVDNNDYISDVRVTLSPQVRSFILATPPDLDGLQTWLEGIYDYGFASQAPIGFGDSPIAPIVREQPVIVISPERVILAQTPQQDLTNRTYTTPSIFGAEDVVNNALKGNTNPLSMYTLQPNGDYFLAVPITTEDQEAVLAVVVLTIAPPPSILSTIWPYFLGVLLLTGIVMLIGVTPFGALFGFIMSRPLTRRLKNLAAAADAWSEGRFDVRPKDRSGDEIGVLGVRLQHMAEQLQSLLQTRQELAVLEERNRLARDLHDTVKQQNFATLMQIRAAKNLVETDPATARQHLEEAEILVKASQQELGLLITELRPAALDGQGLPAALKAYLDSWSHHTHLPGTLTTRGERPLPLNLEQALYRVAQESLANVARHSGARTVALHLSYEDTRICLEITDDGAGFDPANASSGFGLESMKQRMAEVGGRLEVVSGKGEGTRVKAEVFL
ncbi:MAG: HAMP domain-containing protein [Anaerolineales bacterium]|nr:HAMP domain-containing protein [Anaerolineales bacterium]